MRKKMLWLVIVLALIATSLAPTPALAVSPRPPIPIIVDTDMGVDDAAALAYLLKQPRANILGITTLTGNTSVENAANNALIFLEAANRTNIPVVIGAEVPLTVTASHQGMFFHGPDGLWGLGYANPHDLSGLSHDAVGFLCTHAQAGVTLLALGPATNIAQAAQACPAQMALYQVVWLGGGKSIDGEGSTAVSAFNAWFDPEATEVILNSGLQLTMVTTDAARAVTLSPDVFTQLARHGNTLGKLVAGPLQMYAAIVTQQTGALPTGLGGDERSSRLYADRVNVRTHFPESQVALFDPTAAVIVMHPEYISDIQSGLVVVDPAASFRTRGQTIVALTLQEKVWTIADDAEISPLIDQAMTDPTFDLYAALAEILMRQPDNAQVVMKVGALRVKLDWLKALVF